MTVVEAMQAALAVEHQVVYGYGVVGARGGKLLRRAAREALLGHEQRRLELERYLRAAGVQPVAAAPAYRLPFEVIDEPSAARLAAQLETAATGASWDVVAAAPSGDEVRGAAVRWLAESTRALEGFRLVEGRRDFLALPGQPS